MRNMKRFVGILTAAAMMIGVLSGCQKTENEQIMANDNLEMETLTAMDVVSEMKIGWNLGNTMDSLNSNLVKKMPPEN